MGDQARGDGRDRPLPLLVWASAVFANHPHRPYWPTTSLGQELRRRYQQSAHSNHTVPTRSPVAKRGERVGAERCLPTRTTAVTREAHKGGAPRRSRADPGTLAKIPIAAQEQLLHERRENVGRL